MTWDPPGLWASVILSVLGGTFAGVIVLVGEILIRRELGYRQQSKAAKAVGLFFEEWEMAINGANAIQQQGGAPGAPKAFVQFALHENFLRRAPRLIQRWQGYLTVEQVEEISNFIEGHQGAVIGILPAPAVLPQQQYDQFFGDARQIKWVKF